MAFCGGWAVLVLRACGHIVLHAHRAPGRCGGKCLNFRYAAAEHGLVCWGFMGASGVLPDDYRIRGKKVRIQRLCIRNFDICLVVGSGTCPRGRSGRSWVRVQGSRF